MIKVEELIKFLEDNKLKNISLYNVENSEVEKFIIIATANSSQQSKNVADLIAQKYGYQDKIEGYTKGEWIVFDFNVVTLHIFLLKVREKYNLDKLYKPLRYTIKK